MSETTTDAQPERTAGLFDLRYILAVLFGIFGVVLIVMGLVSFSAVDARKTGGININLWAGLVMAVVAAAFGLWAWLRPVVLEAQARPEDMAVPGEQ